jgi:hypothetical protein
MNRTLRLTLPAIFAGGLVLSAGLAEASPQVLGLVASIRPTPMQCGAAGCRADLSSFCLEQPRPYPILGTVYGPAPNTKLTLVVTGRDGQIRRLDGTRYLAFVDDRGFASVTARLTAADLARLDAASVAIEVGKDASLLPVAKAADPDPQSNREIALATGVSRKKAETFFDRPGRDADAIRLTNAMINYLPPGELGRNPADSDVLAKTEALYQGAPVDPAGVRQAEEIHSNCVAKVDVRHQIESMRDCLEGSHDILLTHTNIDFWNSLGGS